MKLFTYICLVVAATFQQTPSYASEEKFSENKLQQLEERINIAENENALWRDTQKLLSAAKQHVANGENEQATVLLDSVEFQLNQGLM